MRKRQDAGKDTTVKQNTTVAVATWTVGSGGGGGLPKGLTAGYGYVIWVIFIWEMKNVALGAL